MRRPAAACSAGTKSCWRLERRRGVVRRRAGRAQRSARRHHPGPRLPSDSRGPAGRRGWTSPGAVLGLGSSTPATSPASTRRTSRRIRASGWSPPRTSMPRAPRVRRRVRHRDRLDVRRLARRSGGGHRRQPDHPSRAFRGDQAGARGGKHVYSEKPMALRHVEAAELADLARGGVSASGVRLRRSWARRSRPRQRSPRWSARAGPGDLRRRELGSSRPGTRRPRRSRGRRDRGRGPLSVDADHLDPGAGAFGPGIGLAADARSDDPGWRPFRIGSPDLEVAMVELASGAVIRLTTSFYVGRPAKQRGRSSSMGRRLAVPRELRAVRRRGAGRRVRRRVRGRPARPAAVSGDRVGPRRGGDGGRHPRRPSPSDVRGDGGPHRGDPWRRGGVAVERWRGDPDDVHVRDPTPDGVGPGLSGTYGGNAGHEEASRRRPDG